MIANETVQNFAESNEARSPFSTTEWLVCAVASLGFAFDIYEILMMPLILRPALEGLGAMKPGTAAFNFWAGLLFYLPAAAGGVFGLLGGLMADRFGRRRVLVWSILLYSLSACMAAFASSVPMLLVLRCTTWIGLSVEFVAGIAWVAETFSSARQREWALGLTQAFGGTGGLLVTAAYYLSVTYGHALPPIAGSHEAWRYTLISGAIPAIPLLFVRPLLPESRVWKEKRAQGILARPGIRQLFSPELRTGTIITVVMVACSYGAAYGAIQHVPRIVPGLDGMGNLPAIAREQRIGWFQLIQEFGHLTGRLVLAGLAPLLPRPRTLVRLFQVPTLLLLPLLFFLAVHSDATVFAILLFLGTVFVTGQFSFWGNYLPRLYPTHLRATGEAFATNVGGRLIGTLAAVLTTQWANWMPGANPPTKLSHAAGAVSLLVSVAALTATFWLPEPKQQDQLPE